MAATVEPIGGGLMFRRPSPELLNVAAAVLRSPPVATTEAFGPQRLTLRGMAETMRSQIQVKDRKHIVKLTPMCFLGSEAVQWMTATGQVDSLERAIELGNMMAARGLFFEVTGQHAFRDKPYMYRFAEDEFDRLAGGKDKIKLSQLPYESLLKISGRMRQEVGVGDHEYKGTVRSGSFSGEDAVNWLLQEGFAPTEVDASALGNSLLRAGLIQHTDRTKIFQASRLYRFSYDVFIKILDRKSKKNGDQSSNSPFSSSPGGGASPDPSGRYQHEALFSGEPTEYSPDVLIGSVHASVHASVHNALSGAQLAALLDDDDDEGLLESILNQMTRSDGAPMRSPSPPLRRPVLEEAADISRRSSGLNSPAPERNNERASGEWGPELAVLADLGDVTVIETDAAFIQKMKELAVRFPKPPSHVYPPIKGSPS